MATKKKKKSALDDVNSGIVFPTIFSKEMNDRLIAAKSDDIAPLAQPRRKETTSFYEDFAPVRTVGTLSKDDDIAPTRKWFNKGLLKDGYDAGDIAKTILGTATDLDQNVKAGVLGIGEKVVDTVATGIGALGGVLGNEKFKDKARDFVAKDLYDEHKLAANPIIQSNPFASVSHILGLDADETSVLGEKSDDLAYSGGQLLGTVALQGVGVPWFVTTGATSFGSEVETAFQEGANYKEATLRGGISAGADILTEKLTGGIKFGGKTLDDALLRPLTQKISNKLARNLVNVGLDATGEGFEEVLASVANNLGEKLYNEDAKVKDLLLSEQAMDEYIESFIGGFVLGGGSGSSRAIQSITTGRDYKTGLTDNEQKVVDAEVKKRISEEEKDGKKLSAKERTAIEEGVRSQLEKGYISIDSIESALGGETYNAYKALSDEMDEYTSLNKMKAIEMTGEQSDRLAELKEKNKQTSYESEKARLKEQLSQEVDGLTQSDAFLRESYNEKFRRGQAFEADLKQYKSKEQQVIIQKAIDSKILNNTRRTHEFVDMISKIAADKGVSFDFTDNAKLKESGFAIDGKTVNGYVQGNNISLNIQSAKSLNKVVGHEITHVLESTELYSELQKVVREYATTKGEYGTRLEALQALYKDVDGANIENELTADLIGDYLFTDEKFVNNLSTKNPNIFKKIFEEIKYLVKVATAGSKEAKELEKVKRIFEKAYKQTSNADNNVKYAFDTAEDEKLHTFIEKALAKEIPDKYRYEISETISDRLASDIEAIVGFSVRGYKNKITSGRIRHIYKRHGENGTGDNSLENTHDIAKMGYVIKNYDKIAMGDELNAEFKNADDSLSKTIVLQKKIGDEYYYVIEAVPDSAAKTLFVTSAYINKNDTIAEAGIAQSLNPDVRDELQSDVSFDNIIPESQENTTKKSLSEKNGDIAPIGNYNVYGSDIALDPTEDIAPVRSDIQQKNSDVRRGYKPLTEKQANARDKERMAAEFPPGISKIARNQIARELKEILPFAVSGQVKRVEEMIQRYADSENPDGNTLYMEIKEEFASNTLKRRIEEVADVQAALRSTKIAVSDAIKNGITDFNALRKSNFGKIRFAKDGLPVDTVYQELSMMYPNYFPEDIVNPSDQLLQMIDVANQERYANEEITADGKAIARATNHIMDRVEEYKKSREERERRKRESRAYLHATIIDKIKTAFSAAGFDFDEVLKNAKNKSTFASVDNTPIRFIEKTFGYKAGQILNKLTMDQTALNESEGIKWLNSFTNRKNGVIAQIVKQYGIKPGSKESAAAQMYGEGFYVNDKNELIQYGDMELMRDFPDAKVRENIKKLATDPRIRQIYDETLDKINESRTRNAYPEIPRRNNYFLHFRAMDDTFSRLGLPFNPNDIRAKDLPTDLNGVTADLKPGQPYFASANQRKGHKTTYDLLGGLEKYLTSAKNQIYHIDDIQTLRALRNYIATMFGQAHGLDNIDQMTEEEAEARIKDVFGSHLSVFSRFLTEEANVLAGKTSMVDRSLEGIFGRKAVTTLDTINKQVGSNMIGFNLSSSLTNLVSVVQGFSKANKADALKAFAQVAANKVNGIYGRSDGFADQNPLIIRRKGADRYTRTPWQKASDAGFIFMGAIDNISTEFIVRAKYNELTRKGMDSETAHVESSKWAARILGDRSYGQQPLIFNSKTLGLFTKFQLEVRNQLDSMFYDTIQEAKLSTEEMDKGFKKNAVIAGKITVTIAQLAVFQHLFGKAFESVAGYNPTFDIIDAIIKACGFDDEEDSEDAVLDNVEEGFLTLLEDLPYVSTLVGGGRIPISSALPVTEVITGQDSYGNEKPRWETVLETLPYYFAPTGTNQAKKTMQGLSMFDGDLPISGSYTKNTVIDKMKGDSPGNLRFSVEDTIPNKIQAAVFGQWASQNARQYFDEGLAPLKEKQVQEYIDSGVSMQEYWDYRKGLSGLKTNAEKSDYIASLDLPVKAKNTFINNVLDRKEEVDVTGYENYSDFEEFDYAQKNPEKYTVAKSVGGYDSYLKYADKLSGITADKDSNGKTIRGSRKEKVADYISSLDLEDGAKYILFKSEYPADDTYNYEIIDYLNSRDDISYSEMKTILEELDFKVDEEGNISW